jgi:N-acyl-D-amino-acid deacylase
MTDGPKKITRRAVLAGIGGLAVAAQAGNLPGGPTVCLGQGREGPRALEDKIPVTGKAGPGLKPLDAAMLKIMDRHGIPGAALAIAAKGKLVLAKGYGWANTTANAYVEPDTLFGLASLSKPLTAAATLLLVEQGKLNLDDPVFRFLQHVRPARGARVDPRLGSITIRQCLNHSGGWDRKVNGDPINWEPQICRAYRVRPPLSPAQFISFAMSLPLNFKPGTDAQYSNVGFILLGEVVARVSGQPYERFVGDNILRPMGIKRVALHPRGGRYLPGEAHRYLPGTYIPLPPMNLPMVDATGGWSGSVVDLARFLTNMDGSRSRSVLGEKVREQMLAPPPPPIKPRPNGSYFGLGWDGVKHSGKAVTYAKEGSYQGMRTFMKRTAKGLNWALLYNSSMEFDPQDVQMAAGTVHDVRHLVEGMGKYPDIDLFGEYP